MRKSRSGLFQISSSSVSNGRICWVCCSQTCPGKVLTTPVNTESTVRIDAVPAFTITQGKGVGNDVRVFGENVVCKP